MTREHATAMQLNWFQSGIATTENAGGRGTSMLSPDGESIKS